ncbi:MAG: efflux RND transporter permease subunit [Deltaproteobacteria bacterium]|nr:efflux RND transporter permease subunit [Deltaproteobacteria bacterium]
MNLTDFSIKDPVTVIVGVLLLVLFGLIGLMRIPVQLTPDVVRPTISVRTYWPGGSPVEVEREIVEEQEERLKSVEGLYKMTSESRDGRGTVTLEFQLGTDVDAALLKVSNKLQQVPRYPDEARKPILIPAGEHRTAMMWNVVRGLPGRVESVFKDRDFIENYVKPRLERVPGVAAVNVYGGTEREMQVIVDPQKLAARWVTIQEVIRAVATGNKNTSAGEFDEGKRRYIVRTVGEYQSPQDIERVIIKNMGGDPIYVRDVARVQLAHKKPTYFATRDKGTGTIVINAVRATGANVLTVMAGLKEAIAELNQGVLADRKLEIYQTYDETTYIKSAIRLVRNNLFLGGSLAICVLLLFLRSITSTLIIATTIPISVIGAFFLMTLFGRNINVISLAGMAFAVGIVVDAAIVVLENIYRHREEGEPLKEAALNGTREVWGAILASSLTTIAVFAPVVYMQEEVGQLFRDIAIAISSAVFLSLIVSITVIPTFASRILGILRFRKKREDLEVSEGASPRQPARPSFLNWPFRAFARSVPGITRWAAGRTWAQVLIIALLTSASLGMAFFLAPKAEYLPEGNRDSIFALMIPPPGYNLGQFEKMARNIKKDLSPYWSVQPGTPEAAELDAPPIRSMFFFAYGQTAFMGISPFQEDAQRIKELYPVIRRAISKLPGVISIVRQPSLFARGIGAGRSINLEITGPDLDRVLNLGQRTYGQLRKILPRSQIRPIPALDLGNPEVRIIPDRERAAEAGLNASQLGSMVDVLLDGLKASDYRYHGEKIDLTVMGEPGRIMRTQDLINIPVKTPDQRLITLGSISDIKTVSGPMQINHIERERAVTIQVIPPETMPLQTAMEMVEEKVVRPIKESGELGDFHRIKLAGTADKLTQTREALTFNFILALVITFLLMAALFASFVYPLIIMFSVPLAAAGGFLGLAAVNAFISYQALDVLTMLGFVILIGIVVNNAILIVHQALNNIRYKGLVPREAVAESVRTRLRPIFMSMTTSVFGMSPLVFFPGAGSEIYRGLGSVVIGGLIVSTVFTIFLVPSLLSLVLNIQVKIGRGPRPENN